MKRQSQKQFLKEYDVSEFDRPSVTVDLVMFTVMEGALKVLMIRRGQQPFSGCWALPGGFVHMDETLEEAAARELGEETGVDSEGVYLEQLYTFGDPGRDPRTRVITVAYFALVDSSKIKPHITGQEGISDIQWFSVHELPKEIAFDHGSILEYALKRLRNKLEYTAVGLELLPELFTLTELQNLYETILVENLDKRNFRKKALSMGILEESGSYRKGGHRPAMQYRFKKTHPTSTFKRTRFEGSTPTRKKMRGKSEIG
jgi:8-oxo-dGTP diphosphatase